MKKQMYSLLDHTAQVFLNPLSFQNDGDAVRWFTTTVNSKEETNISKYPEQFTLYRLADFDGQTGMVEPTTPKQLITGIQVQEEQLKSFSVKDLIAMLQHELQLTNVIDIADKKA
jgi:hypothetical protein